MEAILGAHDGIAVAFVYRDGHFSRLLSGQEHRVKERLEELGAGILKTLGQAESSGNKTEKRGGPID